MQCAVHSHQPCPLTSRAMARTARSWPFGQFCLQYGPLQLPTATTYWLTQQSVLEHIQGWCQPTSEKLATDYNRTYPTPVHDGPSQCHCVDSLPPTFCLFPSNRSLLSVVFYAHALLLLTALSTHCMALVLLYPLRWPVCGGEGEEDNPRVQMLKWNF